jgi:hypothetical protein
MASLSNTCATHGCGVGIIQAINLLNARWITDTKERQRSRRCLQEKSEWEEIMRNTKRFAALLVVGAVSLASYNPAHAAPLTSVSAAVRSIGSTTDTVQVRFGGWGGHGGWGHGGWGHGGHGGWGGWGWGGGALAAGALIGAAIASSSYYGGYPYDDYGYSYPHYGYTAGYYPSYGYGYGYGYHRAYRHHYGWHRPYWHHYGAHHPHWRHSYAWHRGYRHW